MDPMYAAAAMSLSSITVCLNALRLNLLKIRDPSRDKASRRALRKNSAPEEEVNEGKNHITVNIDGMMCEHCEAAVKGALESLDYVESAAPDHNTGTCVIDLAGEADVQAIQSAVESKGYTYKGVKE